MQQVTDRNEPAAPLPAGATLSENRSQPAPVSTDERAILFAISYEIAAIRDKSDLLAVLNDKIRSLFYFDGITIIIHNNDKKAGYDNFITSCNNTYHPPLNFDAFNDALFKLPLLPAGPQLFSIATVADTLPADVFEQLPNLKEFAGVSLRQGETVFGGLYLFSEQVGNYSVNDLKIIRGIADQLSVAVANILANEKLIKKEQENAVLLSLSNAIATIRNKRDLFNVINLNLKSILPFDDFVICLINADRTTHSAYLYNEADDFQKQTGTPPAASKNYPLDDGLCQMMISAAGPVVFAVEDVLKSERPPAWLSFWHHKGIREMTGFAINDRDTCIGFFYLYARRQNAVTSKYYDLLKSIGLQISVAIANIKAYEKIEAQLLEIDTYKQQLEGEKLYLQEQIDSSFNHTEIIGSSAPMQRVFHLINQVAPSDSTVLILGETGTGKELIARAIHNNSNRKSKLMIKLNCATLPPNLIESELFGHEKGSFTGATERRIGKFELANNSTLFLDEIGELSLELQVKLLRVLQEKEIERIGGKTVIKTNVRIITATNRNLLKEVQDGSFRSDLYYRLNVFPITLPPLRDRKDDIGKLAMHFIDKYAWKAGKKIKNVSQQVIKNLMAYNWPGNIRELEHLIERSVLLTAGPTITEVYLPKTDKKDLTPASAELQVKSIFENERDHILAILKLCKGKIAGVGGAAELLGVPATTLNSKIKKFNIKREHMLK